MTIYDVHKTKLFGKNSSPIHIDEKEIDQSTDITLFGRKKLQYGTQLNQNILHLLEHFACPENSANPGNPDLDAASADQISNVKFLTNPIDGQLWFNSTQDCLFVYNANVFKWEPVGMQDDIAANWGVIYNGQQIPKPVSTTTGHVFDYSECSWIVSPYQFPGVIEYMLCNTGTNAEVTSIYSVTGDPTIYDAFATYLIVGIRGNINQGSLTPIPSPTPTPAVTPTVTTTPGAVTPTPTPPTPTPTPSSLYVGPLTAALYNASTYNSTYSGDVDPWWTADFKDISYPGVTTNRYNLYTTSTFPAAPHNPWVESSPGSNIYYLYTSVSRVGGGGSFPTTTPTQNKYIFVSNDGTNGLFYRVLDMTIIGGTMLRIRIDTSANTTFSYYNRVPQQTNDIPQLQFSNYGFVYEVSTSFGASIIDQTPFLFTCPTPYLQNFTLDITGGQPPYTISDVRYSGNPHPSRPVSVIRSGINQENFAATPVSFQNIATVASKFTGPLATGSNPNIVPILNGFRINNFLTADIYYPSNYQTVYSMFNPNCKPESFWLFDNDSGCQDFSGYGTNIHAATAVVDVTDALGTTVTTPLLARWNTQTYDRKYINTLIGLNASITGMATGIVATSSGSYGIPAGSLSSVPGTYSYDINLLMDNSPLAIYPTVALGRLKYLFSMLRPPDNTHQGNWTHTGPNLSTLIQGLCYAENDALLHVGQAGTFTLNPLTPYNGTTGSIQEISIVQYIDINNVSRDISGNPIRVKLYPTASGNSWTWHSLNPDGTNNNLTQTSNIVPYDMKIDFIIPAGLPASGSLIIPLAITCTQFGVNSQCYGTGTGGGQFFVQINFSNV